MPPVRPRNWLAWWAALAGILAVASSTARWLTRSTAPLAPGQILVALRYDDLTAASDWPAEQRLVELASAHRLPVSVAVIPALFEPPPDDALADSPSPPRAEPSPRDAESDDERASAERASAGRTFEEKVVRLRHLAESGVVEIAQHGWTHYYRTDRPWPRTELAGLTYRDQRSRIQRGKKRLERTLGVTVKTFMPPWNSYDATTLRVLNDLGFELVSAGRRGTADLRPGRKLGYLPATCEHDQVRAAVAEARQTGGPALIVVQLHPYNLGPDGSLGLEGLERLVAWLGSQPDVAGVTLSQALAQDPARGREVRANQWAALWGRLVPAVIRWSGATEHGYLLGARARRAAWLGGIEAVGLYASWGLVACAVGRGLWRGRRWGGLGAWAGCGLVLLAIGLTHHPGALWVPAWAGMGTLATLVGVISARRTSR